MSRVNWLYYDFQSWKEEIEENLEGMRLRILQTVLGQDDLQIKYPYRFKEPHTIDDLYVGEYDELYIDDITVHTTEKPKLIVNFKRRDKYEAFIISIDEFKEYVYG